jgi:hypothetical protein
MRNVSGKNCRENENTRFFVQCIFPEIIAIYVIKGEKMVQLDRPQMIIWRMRVACWITNAKNTNSAYVIRIDFPL